MLNKHILLLGFLLSHAITGAQNYSLYFDGEGGYASFPECEALISPYYTIEGWLKCEASRHTQVFFMSYLDVQNKNANVTLEVRPEGNIRFNYRYKPDSIGGYDLLSQTKVNDGEWHHFAAIKEGEERIWIYIDGFPDKVVNVPILPITQITRFELGRNRYEEGRNFRGYLDDLKIWKYAKTPRQVFENFQSESSGVEALLFGNYPFNAVSDSLFDCSLYKRSGIRVNQAEQNHLPEFSKDHPDLQQKKCETGDAAPLDPAGPWVEMVQERKLVYLYSNASQRISFKVSDASGNILQSEESRKNPLMLDFSDKPKGVYTLYVSSGLKNRTFKVKE